MEREREKEEERNARVYTFSRILLEYDRTTSSGWKSIPSYLPSPRPAPPGNQESDITFRHRRGTRRGEKREREGERERERDRGRERERQVGESRLKSSLLMIWMH